MMGQTWRSRLMRAVCVGAAAMALSSGGCSTSKTVVLVHVTGEVDGIMQLVVNLRAGGLATTIYVKETPELIVLPKTFTIEMDRSRTGELDVAIDATNASSEKIATGSGMVASLVIGEQQEMTVELTPVVAPPPPPPEDGGADGGTSDDAGDDAGEAETGDDATAEDTGA